MEMEDLKMASKNAKVVKVCTGFFSLSEAEKEEVIQIINEYLKETSTEKKASIVRTFNRASGLSMDLGPTGSRCPCCGK